MAQDKGKKAQTPSESDRIPADKLLVEFMKTNNIVMIADEVALLTTDVPDTVYSISKKIRIRAYYSDQFKKIIGDDKQDPKDKIEIVN